jgi:4-hydroxy-2-oxoheptanedioate aldolase
MDKLHNPFKQALKSGKLQLGLWHSLSSHIVAEILADAGFDWILLDTSMRRTSCHWCWLSFRR